MKRLVMVFVSMLALAALTSPVFAGGDYAVTVTNLTRGQILSPVLVATHKPGHSLFMLGHPASEELARLAEGGDNKPLMDALLASGEVHDAVSSEGGVMPGQSVTVVVRTMGVFRNFSVASMLVSTNDAFIAVNDMRVPLALQATTILSPAYDAGSEPNDELCAHVPGPPCGGEGFSEFVDGEGYVHIHAGVHGIGGLTPSDHDWRNPVARISIQRM